MEHGKNSRSVAFGNDSRRSLNIHQIFNKNKMNEGQDRNNVSRNLEKDIPLKNELEAQFESLAKEYHKNNFVDHKVSLKFIRFLDSINPGTPQEKNLVTLINESPLLMSVIFLRDKHLAAALLERPIDVNIKTKSGLTPLHLAAHEGESGIFHELLRRRADLWSVASNGRTPFHEAVIGGNIDIMRACTINGVDWDKQDNRGNDAASLAYDAGKSNVLKYLFELGVNKEQFKHPSYLISSIRNNDFYMVKLLLEIGSKPNVRLKNGSRVIDLADKYGDDRMIRLMENYLFKEKSR